MKKILALALALCFVAVCFVGCGKETDKTAKIALENYIGEDYASLVSRNSPTATSAQKIEALDGYTVDWIRTPFISAYKEVEGFDTYIIYNIPAEKIVLTVSETADYDLDIDIDDSYMFEISKDYGDYEEYTYYTASGVKVTSQYFYSSFHYHDVLDVYVVGDTAYSVAEDGTVTVAFNTAATTILDHDMISPVGDYYVTYNFGSSLRKYEIFSKDFKFIGDCPDTADQMTAFGLLNDKFFIQGIKMLPDDAEEFTCYVDFGGGSIGKAKIVSMFLDPAAMEATYVDDIDFVAYETLFTNEVIQLELGNQAGAGDKEYLKGDAIIAIVSRLNDNVLKLGDPSTMEVVALNEDLTIKESLAAFTGMNLDDMLFDGNLLLLNGATDYIHAFNRETGDCIAVVDEDVVFDKYYFSEDGIYEFLAEDGTANKKIYDFTQSVVQNFKQTDNALFFEEGKVVDGAFKWYQCICLDGAVRQLFEITTDTYLYTAYTDGSFYEVRTLVESVLTYQLYLADGTLVVSLPYPCYNALYQYRNYDLGAYAGVITVVKDTDGNVYVIK